MMVPLLLLILSLISTIQVKQELQTFLRHSYQHDHNNSHYYNRLLKSDERNTNNDNTNTNTNTNNEAIIGGNNAPPGEYPWYSLITVKGKKWCGASLISPSYALTAAHCFVSNDGIQDILPHTLQVFVGAYKEPFVIGVRDEENSIRDNNGGQEIEIFKVSELILHPDWMLRNNEMVEGDSSSFVNDFALLRLNVTDGVAMTDPVALDVDGISEQYKGGKDLWVTGFGTTLDSINDIRFDNEPTVLQHLKVMYIPNEDCEEPAPFEYPTGFISETMMCASDPGVGDSCEGDSGGPLFDKETGTLVGIVSWGVNCANEAYPGVNARVSKAVDWIKKNVNDLPNIKLGGKKKKMKKEEKKEKKKQKQKTPKGKKKTTLGKQKTAVGKQKTKKQKQEIPKGKQKTTRGKQKTKKQKKTRKEYQLSYHK